MIWKEEVSKEEIEAVVSMYIKLPKEERALISNSAYTLCARNQMQENLKDNQIA